MIVTDKEINISQLCQELGNVALEINGPDGDGNYSVMAEGVSDETLASVIFSHVAEAVVEELPSPSPVDLFNALPPEQAEAVLTVALGLVNQAGPLFDSALLIPVEDPANEPISIIAGVVLDAAIPLLGE